MSRDESSTATAIEAVMTPAATGATGAISLRNVGVHFGAGRHAVQAVQGATFDIAPGEFVSVLGPSGCGKSTLLGVLAGFTQPSSGEALVDGLPVERPGADRAVVFQQPTLFPWKRVLANVAFGPKMRGVGRAERKRIAADILREVGLADFHHHFPVQLSGGMQQRVSLARVLVNRPRVLLMDEPFGALDAQTRLQMQELLLELWAEHRITVLFVTHDIDEAIFLGDRVLVFSQRPGRIVADFKVELPRPRTPALLTGDHFVYLKRRCLGLLRPSPTGRAGDAADLIHAGEIEQSSP